MSTVKDFLSGMVRGFGAITIIPRHDRRPRRYASREAGDNGYGLPRILTEREAMAKDWEAVGDSIRAAIGQYEATHGRKQ